MNSSYKKIASTLLTSALGLSFVNQSFALSQNWLYSYDDNGQLLSTDGPRTDANDLISYTYDDLGNATSITNALGHTVLMQNHNSQGKPGRVIDANGTQTVLTYNARGWLLSRSVGGATIRYSYDNEGLLLSTTLANGTVLTNEYDAAHRLTGISNNLGERIEYSLDAAGNHVGERTRSSAGAITRSFAQAYDELDRLIMMTGAGGQTRSYSYDENGNQVAFTDGNLNTTTTHHDALNRLVTSLAPLNQNSLREHDAQGNLIRVTDPKALETDYSYDGLDNLVHLASPDSGLTQYNYDEAGNRVSQTDGNGITASYSYDALNRLIGTSYPNAALNIDYGYDAGSYGIGKLTSIADASGRTVLDYDHRGNITGQNWDAGGTNIGVSYVYNTTDQLMQINYPSGRVVSYIRGADGRITTVTTSTPGEGTATVASGVDYLPFGPTTKLDYGNGLQYSASYDLDYRVAHMAHGNLKSTQYGYDAADNIINITGDLNPDVSQIFSYDALNRLGGAQGSYGSLGYNYDATGNRISYTDNAGVHNYAYDTNSHRLLSANPWDYEYDNNGNLIAKISRLDATGDGYRYVYDDNNRLGQVLERKTVVSAGGQGTEQIDTVLANYTYNAKGQRSRKASASGNIHYVYSLDGLLLAEVDENGQPQREYIYLNGQPLAVANTTAIHEAQVPGTETFIDDGEEETTATGSWGYTRKKGAYNDYYSRSEDAGNSYRWTPANLKESSYEVYAWWPKTRKNNRTAEYRIFHSGQSSTSVQDQGRQGKKWMLLGTYAFSGSGGEYIELSDAGGKTAADGIRFVELVEPPPTITTAMYYIHNDHLGTPQVITDQSQAVVWSANYKPFGEVEITQSTIANNLRFPGQYFDEETGLHQNYFRDYDPGLGRYVESDPIGLGGGFNTYQYAGQNPLIKTDKFGLIEWTGTATTISLTGPVGATITKYTLTSQPVNGKTATVKITALGPSLGFGVNAGATRSNVVFQDSLNFISPQVFDGKYEAVQAGITVPFGPGIGGSALNMGSAGSYGFGRIDIGYDASISITSGSSVTTDITWKNEHLCDGG